jgi:putative transcriptional regulator
MTARRHPAAETLVAYAAGALGAGARLVVKTHLGACSACRDQVRACEAIGGALLENEAVGPAPSDLLARTWARIEAAPKRSRTPAPPPLAPEPYPGAPELLRHCAIGPWRFVQPGLRVAMVTPPGEIEASAMLMRVSAGRRMPKHTHDGVEFTQVLSGVFYDASGRYAAGDYIEADEAVDHQPVADEVTDCICLAAVEGRLRLTSFVGRLAQSMLGF